MVLLPTSTSCGPVPVFTLSGHSFSGQTYWVASTACAGLIDQHRMGSPFQYNGSDLQIVGFPTMDMFLQFMSCVPEPSSLEVHILSQPWRLRI